MIELYDRSTHLFICVVTILPFAFCTLFVRCYVRWTSRTWGVDDWCMLFSAPFFAWLSASCISAAIHGIGAHVQNFHGGLEGQKAALQDFFMFEVSYCLAMLLAKPSIALMLVRIAESKRLYVWILRSVMALQSITLLVVLIYLFAMCKPISYAWDKSIPDGHCASSEIITVFSYVVAGVNVAFDLTCALLPIPLLWNIQLNRNTRVASCILLGFGIFASVCVLVRLKYNIGLSATEDFFYNICPILTYCYAEAGIGMVAANGSTLRPLFRHCFGGTPADSLLSSPKQNPVPRDLRSGAFELCHPSDSFVGTMVRVGTDPFGSQLTFKSMLADDDDSERDVSLKQKSDGSRFSMA